MTPFALLEKSAYWGDPTTPQYAPQTGYKYQQGASGLNNPYAEAKRLTPERGWGGLTGMGAELGADIALGSNALTGVPWFAGKAIYSGLKGNWGDAVTNLGMGAMSLIPGAGSAAAAGKGALAAGRVATTLGRAGKLGQSYVAGIGKLQGHVQKGLTAATKMPGLSQVAHGTGVARNWVTQPGAMQGVRNTAWGLGASTAKFAPVTVVGSALPNNQLQNPTAPAPKPMQNNGSLTDAMAQSIASGKPQ